MSSLAVYADARSLLLDAVLVPPERIHFANEPFSEPNPPDLWMSVDAYSPNVDILDIGARVYQEQATIQVMCIAPAGTGTDGVRQLASDLCNVFRNLGPRNPYYLNASIGEGSQSEDGLWFALPVSIDAKYESTPQKENVVTLAQSGALLLTDGESRLLLSA